MASISPADLHQTGMFYYPPPALRAPVTEKTSGNHASIGSGSGCQTTGRAKYERYNPKRK